MMSAIGYVPETQTLTIVFQSGKKYEYSAVEPEVFKDFLESDSKGRYFNEYIDECYEYRLVFKGKRR